MILRYSRQARYCVFWLIALMVPLAQAEYLDNLQIWAELRSINERTQVIRSQLQDVQRQHERLRLNEGALNEHIIALSGSSQIFRVLQEQNANLPRFEIDSDLPDLIANTRLAQFRVTQQQREFRDNPGRYPHDLQLTELQDGLQQLVGTAVALQQAQRDLAQTAERMRATITEHLFWIPSNPAMGPTWVMDFPGKFLAQIQRLPQQLSLGFNLNQLGLWQWLLLAAILVLAAVLQWFRPRLNEQLSLRHQPVLAYQERLDQWQLRPEEAAEQPEPAPPSPWLTPQSLLIHAALSLPMSLGLLVIGVLLSQEQGPEIAVIGKAFIAVALSLFVVQFLLAILEKGQEADFHLGWTETTRETLRRFTYRFARVLLPTSAILALAQQQGVDLTEDVIGPIILVVAAAMIAHHFRQLLRDLPETFVATGTRWLLNLVLVMMPLSLAVLTLLGYYHTALQVTGQFLATFYVLSGWVITEVSVRNGIEWSSTRLRLLREAEEREWTARMEAATAMGETLRETPEKKSDLAQVRQQTQRLARFVLLAVFGSLLYWVWADLVGVFGYFNSLVLWQYGTPEAPGIMTVLDLLSALFIVVLTLFLAANLPGVLEMLILSRLALQQGSAYAMTTLLNYVITGIGLVLALSALGVSWDKLQWLVAALSVGLGFGLQEIFANFVSGIILLFERPIRIGDVVTLGNLSGRVRQIHIRATTITDFDRKDIIVPNKTFVTGQLINWSLTDTVTRVVVKIGVAYGSDLERTREILLEAAETNERVLKDPAPQVLFLSFGASTLDHELRIHVKELSDRNPAIDEINRFIDQSFKDANIEIAFQQVDVRFRNSDGLERLISRQNPQSDV